jgi:hypothetical protein
MRDNSHLIDHHRRLPFLATLDIGGVADDRAEVLHLLDGGIEFGLDLGVFGWVVSLFDTLAETLWNEDGIGRLTPKAYRDPRHILVALPDACP